MKIVVIGISHKTASVDIREKFCLSSIEREALLSLLKTDPSVVESIVVSTCNRMEIYAGLIDKGASEDVLVDALFSVKKLSGKKDLRKYIYSYQGRECISHFLRVATSLDSLVLGEKQILGQIKEAVDVSRKKGMLSKQFNILSDVAIRSGKRAQSETNIGSGGVSVSWAAVKMAGKTLKTLENKTVLIIGAGKMSELTANQLKNKGIKHIYIMNRTREKALDIAQKVGGEAVSFWDLDEIINKVDVCICSVGAPHYVIEGEFVEKIMKKRNGKKLICIDISTPRNINPNVADVDNVELYSIDDLQKVVGNNLKKRQMAKEQVEKIIEKKIEEFYNKVFNNHCYQMIRSQGVSFQES